MERSSLDKVIERVRELDPQFLELFLEPGVAQASDPKVQAIMEGIEIDLGLRPEDSEEEGEESR